MLLFQAALGVFNSPLSLLSLSVCTCIYNACVRVCTSNRTSITAYPRLRVQPSVHAPTSGSIHFDLCVHTYIHIHVGDDQGDGLYVRRGARGVHDQASEATCTVARSGSQQRNRGVRVFEYICSRALCPPLMGLPREHCLEMFLDAGVGQVT